MDHLQVFRAYSALREKPLLYEQLLEEPLSNVLQRRSLWSRGLAKAILSLSLIFMILRWLTAFNPPPLSPTSPDTSKSHGPPAAQTIELPIDHFNTSDQRTFKNRYWVNSTHYEKGGPVFFYDGGEAGLSDGQVAGPLTGKSGRSTQLELARHYHGIAIMWEHRFYGGSMPFEYDETSGLALEGYNAYKYLTNEQALEDAVYFARNFNLPGFENLDSNSTPWIWIGGSYAGTRAAIIRQRNPDVFYASWASSAPVQIQVEMPEYYNTMLQTMPANCSTDVHSAITYSDEILTSGNDDEIELLRRAVFLTHSANPKDHRPFNNSGDMRHWDIATILAFPFQGPMPRFQSVGYNGALGKFCDQLQTWNPSNFSGFTMDSPLSVLTSNSADANFTAAGIAASYGVAKAFYAYLFALINKSVRDDKNFPERRRINNDGASWTWQYCSQNGQFHVTSYPSPLNIVSRFYNTAGHAKHQCHERFHYAPDLPDIDAYLKYGGWNMRPSNVMWTDGEFDPWRALSVHATKDINPRAPDRPRTTDVPRCNEPPKGDSVFGLLYPEEVHCSDLRKAKVENGTRPLDTGLELFSRALDSWLQCFPYQT